MSRRNGYGPSRTVRLALPGEASAQVRRLAETYGMTEPEVLRHLAVTLAKRPAFVEGHLFAGVRKPQGRM